MEKSNAGRELSVEDRRIIGDSILKNETVSKTVEAIWRYKSTQTWCKLGDRNAKYFHLVANMRIRRKISEISYNGASFSSPAYIKEAAVSFFFYIILVVVCRKGIHGCVRL